MSGTRQRRHVTRGEIRFLALPRDGTPWTPMRRDMLESPAWRALSRAGFMMISRLCIENSNHAGKENARLAVSFDDFEEFGIDRHAIKRTIAEVSLLGFVQCMTPGQRAYGRFPGRIATYRLTFLGVVGEGARFPTHEWKEIDEAEARSRAASIKEGARRKVKVPLHDRSNGYHTEI